MKWICTRKQDGVSMTCIIYPQACTIEFPTERKAEKDLEYPTLCPWSGQEVDFQRIDRDPKPPIMMDPEGI